jgi:hypothetical protein
MLESSRKTDSGTDDAPPAPARPEAPAAASEWNMEQFRRDLQNIVGRPADGPSR